MGALEDDITEYHRITTRNKRIADLEEALSSCLAAMRDVQEHWSDPSSYTHNRLLTPMLIHEGTITALTAGKGGE